MGDILLSASKTGNVKVGRVEKIHDSGYITVKFAEKRNIRAYERGAPKVPGKKYVALKNEDGTPKMKQQKDYYGGYRSVQEYGYVDCMENDWTVVGKEWRWKQEEAAHYARFVVQSTADHPLFDLHKFLNLDYDKENPEMGDHDKIDDGANEPEGQDHFEEEDDDE